MAKRKTLPKDFEELLKAGDLDALKAVFEKCDVNAYGGHAKETALAFDACPDELARWLVAHGADVNATDTWRNTPLHSRARSWLTSIDVLLELGANVHAEASIGTPLHATAHSQHAEHAKQLLAFGADIHAKNRQGMTALELALSICSNAQLERMPAYVRVLLEAGAERTDAMKRSVRERGEQFELHRAGFAKEGVAAASAGLDYLYQTFGVTPVPRREMHDGKRPIGVESKTWQKQHQELWKLLVPSRGPAETVQGEVIRISGRIGDEWYRNGGANWDRDYLAMANALAKYFQTGEPLSPSEIDEVKSTVRGLAERQGEGNDRLAELAVTWVLKNRDPIKLEKPTSYAR